MKLPIWVLALGAMSGFSAGAATYYISPTGSDTNAGTSTGTPWQTITKVNATSFAAGDQILFQGGQTFAGNLLFGSDDPGTAASPITVSSYGTGKAILDAGGGQGISIYNTAGFIIRNLVVKGAWNSATQSGNNGDGIQFKNDLAGATKLNFGQIDNVEVYGFLWDGIAIDGTPSDNSKSGFTNVEITNCYVHDNAQSGIESKGKFSASATTYAHANINVRRCTVVNNKGITGAGYHTGDGIVLSDVNGAVIERCVAHDNGGLSGGSVAIWTWDSNAVTIQFNEAYNQKSATYEDGDGFDLDGGVTNSILQYNYSHNNYGAGYLVYQFSGARPLLSGNTIRYNISENDARHNDGSHLYGGIALAATSNGSGIQNNTIYNNTIFVSTTGAVGTTSAFRTNIALGVNNRIWNNIFVTSGGARLLTIQSGSNLSFQRNDYYTSGGAFSLYWAGASYASLSAWLGAATTQERDTSGNIIALNVDPVLTAPGFGGTIANPDLLATDLTAYKLLSTSPMIDVGLNIYSQFGVNPGMRDFYSTPISGSATVFDVGAHEFGDAWINQDIGAVGATGSANYDVATSTFTVSGAGADIYGTADAFQFVRRGVKLHLDGSIIARVTGMQNTNSWAKAGIMLRDPTTYGSPGAKNMAIAMTPGGVTSQWRLTDGGSTSYLAKVVVAFPRLLKLTRSGLTITASYLNDSSVWTTYGSQTFGSLPDDLDVGLCVTSHVAGTLCQATFTDVDVEDTATNIPTNLAPGHTATAQSAQTGNGAANANDNSTSSRWADATSGYPKWWKVDLGTVKTITGMDVVWYSSASRSYKYKVEVSDDDSAYTLKLDRTANTNLGDTSDSFSATGRYIRITVTGCNVTPSNASAYEFRIFGY